MKTLLIPGLLCDETVWQPLLAQSGDKAVVAMAPAQGTLTGMAVEILASHPGDLIVFGHSMGARIAMEIARLAPDRVVKLGLFDTGAHPLKEGELEKRAATIKFANDNGMEALAERWLPGMILPAHQKNPAIMQPLEQMVLRMTPELHTRQINALVGRPDASAYLANITCPVLLMVGREDQWSPISQHEDMQELLPNAQLEIVENAGHFSLLENPESTCKIMLAFLNTH